MNTLIRALMAELLKLKRTLALAMLLIAPLAVSLLNLLVLLRTSESMVTGDDFNVWGWLVNNGVGLWGMLMLPLYVTLETALVSGIDHNANAWKHLFALPVPRWNIYLAKQVVNLGIIGLSTIVMIAGALLTGVVAQLSGLKPMVDYGAPVPWDIMPSVVIRLYLAAWLMIAVHTWVSMRWRSFTVASAVGIVATVVSFVLLNSEELAPIYPWTLPLASVWDVLFAMPATALPLPLGFIGGLAFALVACWDVTRRDVL